MLRRLMKTALLSACLFVAFGQYPASAETTNQVLLERLSQLETKVKELEQKLAKYEITESQTAGTAADPESTEPANVFTDGINIGAGGTFIYQFTENAIEDVNDASYSADIEIEKGFGDYGLAFLHLETGDGAGVEANLIVYSNVNRDADDSDNQVQLTELWYEQYFGRGVLTFGKIDATGYIDTNEYANDECYQFLGHIFRNSPTIEFPDNGGGIRINVLANEYIELDAVAMDATSSWDNLYDQGFYAAQLNIKPGFWGRGGNYRLSGWFNDSPHTKWHDMSKTREEGYGFGMSLDQELTDSIGIFARYAWCDPDVFLNGEDFSLEHAYSVGTHFSGSLWNRADDHLGLGFGQVFASDDYKEVLSLRAKAESHLEAYYNFSVNEHLSISPDIQIIWNPYGKDIEEQDNAVLVGGIRSQVDF